MVYEDNVYEGVWGQGMCMVYEGYGCVWCMMARDVYKVVYDVWGQESYMVYEDKNSI